MGQGTQAIDGIGYTTAEFKVDAQIRLLLFNGYSSTIGAACDRAGARRDHLDQRKRPRAYLQATLQYALRLAIAGNSDEAQRVLGPGAENLCGAWA